MTRLPIAATLLCGLFLLAEAAPAFEIQLENATGYELRSIHAFPHDAGSIGANLLKAPIIVGGARALTVPETTERILAVDHEGDSYLVLGLGPRERTQIILSLDDLFYGDPLAQGHEGGLTLVNGTRYDIVSVVLRPVAEGTTGEGGVELLPASQRIPPGRSFVLRVPPAYAGDTIFHVILRDEDGDTYLKRRIDFRRERSVYFTVDDIRW